MLRKEIVSDFVDHSLIEQAQKLVGVKR